MPQELAARYTIVGAGIAGVTAAEAIRELDPTGEILLVNGEEAYPYCRPLIGEEWPRIPLVEGLQRFSRFTPEFAVAQLPEYVPQGYRE